MSQLACFGEVSLGVFQVVQEGFGCFWVRSSVLGLLVSVPLGLGVTGESGSSGVSS
jgi:hypothetical protein